MNSVVPSSYSRRNILACYIFDIFTSIHFSSAIIIPFFITWGKLSYTQIYSLQSWFLICIFLFEIPTGVIADKFGKRFSLRLGALIGAFGLIIFGSVSNLSLFFLAETLAAISAALISGAFEALLYESSISTGSSDRSKKIFGNSHALRMVGGLFAAPLGAFIGAHVGINIPILLDATVLIGAFIVTMFIVDKEVANKIKSQIIESQLQIAKKGFTFLVNHFEARKISILMAIIGIASYYIMWLYQPLLAQINIPLQYYGWFTMLFLGSQAVFASCFGLIERWIKSIELYIGISLIAIFIAFVLILKFPSIYSVILFIIIGSHTSTQLRYISAHINQWIPTAQRATILSILNMVQNTLIVIINPIFGIMADKSLKLGISLIFAIFLACLIGVLFTLRKKIDRKI